MDLAEHLRQLAQEADNLRASGGASMTNVEQYRALAFGIVSYLSPIVVEQDIQRLVMSRSYWTLMENSAISHEQFELEVRNLSDRLLAAKDSVERELWVWKGVGHVLVPDTSVLLHIVSAPSLADEDWRKLGNIRPFTQVTVVLPIVVLDELDGLKRTNDRSRARAVLKDITALLGGYNQSDLGNGMRLDVLVPELEHTPLPVADNEIIDQSLALAARLPFGSSVTLLTADTGMAMRAHVAGLPVRHLLEPAP